MTVYEQLVDEWVEMSIAHASLDDPHVRQVRHDLMCECELEHLRDERKLPA